jgi:DNA-binding NtrC family response regulator
MADERTVLVVDDDDALRMLCRVNLELEGYRVLEAGSTDVAATLLAREPVDVVLLDVHVGNDDGLELLEQIRSTHPRVAVALFTGSADLSASERAAADGVLTKPFSLDDLSDTVGRLAGR